MQRFLSNVTLLVLSSIAFALPAAAQHHADAAEQIASAVLAAPEERRDNAAVLGYVDGMVTKLREGTNDLVCLADNPANDNFSVACYHASLEPFMARGRELMAQGVTGGERKQRRLDEVENGDLPMPREARMLYVLSGDSYDADNNSVANGSLRWVIYVPYATTESTGLSSTASRTAPWLMDAGTAGAHIMLMPYPNEQ